ncbi:hypothetical protein BH23ACT6_BH23ACT6_15340 [soil metagenome]
MHGRPLLLTTSAVLVSVAAAGCSSAVRVAPFDGADDIPACGQVAEMWPTTVGGQNSRVTAADSDTVAAWGDPAIIARCGATVPEPTTSQCLDIADVDWVAQQLDDGVSFTTYGRDPAIQVLVPEAYATEALVMPAFAATATVIPQTLGRCS